MVPTPFLPPDPWSQQSAQNACKRTKSIAFACMSVDNTSAKPMETKESTSSGNGLLRAAVPRSFTLASSALPRETQFVVSTRKFVHGKNLAEILAVRLHHLYYEWPRETRQTVLNNSKPSCPKQTSLRKEPPGRHLLWWKVPLEFACSKGQAEDWYSIGDTIRECKLGL
jgi:hypothetical protein